MLFALEFTHEAQEPQLQQLQKSLICVVRSILCPQPRRRDSCPRIYRRNREDQQKHRGINPIYSWYITSDIW